MKILGIGSVLLSEGGVRYTVTDITRQYLRLRSDLGGFVEFTLRGFEDIFNLFTVLSV